MRTGYVPTARVAPILTELIAERWPHGGGIDVLSEKVKCDWHGLAQIIDQKYEWCDFDLADKLLCALGRADHWYGQLADIYPTKFRETCAIPGCNKKFPETGRGGQRKYCSQKHRNLAALMREGRATGELLRARGKCLKGHRLTPDNTIQGNRCRKCKRERDRMHARRYRAQDPQKHREAVRRYQARKKAAA